MAKRGRPRKSDVDAFKYEIKLEDLTFRGQRHTLEETAKHLGMTKQGVLAIERRALEKIRIGLAKYGIKSLSDVFDPAALDRRSSADDAADYCTIGG